jgi:hypothetical protein
LAIIQDKRTELIENFTCNTIDEVHKVLTDLDNRKDEANWDLDVKFLKDSTLWLVVARASVVEGDIKYV